MRLLWTLITSIKYGPINLWSNRVTLQEIEVKLLNELFFLWMVEKFVVDWLLPTPTHTIAWAVEYCNGAKHFMKLHLLWQLSAQLTSRVQTQESPLSWICLEYIHFIDLCCYTKLKIDPWSYCLVYYISPIFLMVVQVEIDSITAKSYIPEKSEFVQNSLGCDMGIIIFDLHHTGIFWS